MLYAVSRLLRVEYVVPRVEYVVVCLSRLHVLSIGSLGVVCSK